MLCSHHVLGETLKGLVSNLFPERKAAFQEDSAELAGDNPALKKLFAFKDILLPTHGAIKKFTFLPVKSNTP